MVKYRMSTRNQMGSPDANPLCGMLNSRKRKGIAIPLNKIDFNGFDSVNHKATKMGKSFDFDTDNDFIGFENNNHDVGQSCESLFIEYFPKDLLGLQSFYKKLEELESSLKENQCNHIEKSNNVNCITSLENDFLGFVDTLKTSRRLRSLSNNFIGFNPPAIDHSSEFSESMTVENCDFIGFTPVNNNSVKSEEEVNDFRGFINTNDLAKFNFIGFNADVNGNEESAAEDNFLGFNQAENSFVGFTSLDDTTSSPIMSQNSKLPNSAKKNVTKRNLSARVLNELKHSEPASEANSTRRSCRPKKRNIRLTSID